MLTWPGAKGVQEGWTEWRRGLGQAKGETVPAMGRGRLVTQVCYG